MQTPDYMSAPHGVDTLTTVNLSVPLLRDQPYESRVTTLCGSVPDEYLERPCYRVMEI